MSITATPGTSSAGVPRISISISSSDGSPITAVTLNRTVSNATTPVRVQPAPGPSPRIVNDYEADWDIGVRYSGTVTSAAGTETFTSDATSLTAVNPWAIHPTTPALSFRLDQATPNAAGVRSLASVSRDASDVPHAVLGSPYRVFTKTGPRNAPTTQLELTTVTSLEAAAVRAAVNDLTPLLLRIPAAWAWDFESGYYRIGQVDEARVLQYGAEPARIFTLPLERVQAPAGTQQPERTWVNVLTDFPTWAAVRAAYASWTTVLTNTRS